MVQRVCQLAGWSPLSIGVDATPAQAIPGAPVLTATSGDGQITLSWTPTALATSYRIARNGVAVATTTGTSWTATGLLNGTAYSITVQAVVGRQGCVQGSGRVGGGCMRRPT